MKRKKQKLGLLVLVLSLFILTALTGCDSSKKSSSSSSGDQGAISYYVQLNGNAGAIMKNYSNIGAYKQIEKETGVKVDFQHPPTDSDDMNQQFNLMMASGDLPDVIEWYWNTVPGGAEKYLKSGQIIKLNDYIKKYAPNLSKVLKEHPEWKKEISTDSGDIYGFPFLRGDPKLLTFFGPMIRKDWLDKLGLKVPTTIDEWHTVLKAFKTEDPNGNGKADEIPLLPDLNSNAFIGAFGITPGFYQENGTVKYGPMEPEFKDYLALMHQWYKEGLIDPNYVATDTKLRDANVTGNKLGAFISYAGSGIGYYTGLMKDKDPKFKLAGTPYPTLKKGETPIVSQEDNVYTGVAAVITSSNKHIKDTIKFLDYAYGDKGHMLMNFGIEGKSYDMDNGYPKYTKEITNNSKGLPMAQALAQYTRSSWNGPFVQDKRYIEQYMQDPEQKDAVNQWMKGKNAILMPPVTPTPDESTKLASILNDVNTYKDTMINKFIMGKEPLSHFDKYVKTMQGMGIDKAVKIEQAALDRYNKR
ncbi:extracellular solute-binding protein [Pullulanibacillus camelliae]|uniref:extracellular solute-binding protein n=1 Tax=Pullulanibacillus camelliae TaxID=1707096 RepID=UPI0016696534